ncbi:MAG: hypothetical protein ACI4L6_02365 [Candidatus Onthoplasma sp.]
MDIVFEKIYDFFISLQKFNLNYSKIFIAAISVFLFTTICILISTSRAYESRLIKAIDSLNNYFIENPQINEENLVAFNKKMKSKKIPAKLRKHWQQFVLYREDKASHYMSFENCVSSPLRNSTFKRDITILNIITYIIFFASVLLNIFYTYESSDLNIILQNVLLGPILILILNYIITIFLTFRHNAIVSDLYQNYQYFEINIDKATETLPEYVDYEILFSKQEIKRGIPILYTYLQKRAEEEKRELERARLKNVEHERYNFDEAGIDGSLVLERAMQEAENYIAERKKFNQDTEQINSDINAEDQQYREITKEYNRQMQVSRETFANFKQQLEESESTIEINYLKKQQQQELDRQRNLEKEFDTATERHKKIIEGFHNELDEIDKFREQSRQALESAMMSEFATYSEKVLEQVKKAVEEREKSKIDAINADMKKLEEKLASKDEELSKAYSKAEQLSTQLEQEKQNNQIQNQEFVDSQIENPVEDMEQYENFNQPTNEIQNQFEEVNDYNEEPYYSEQPEENFAVQDEENKQSEVQDLTDENQIEERYIDSAIEASNELDAPIIEQDSQQESQVGETGESPIDSIIQEESVAVAEKPKKKAGRPRKNVSGEVKTAKKRGRPKKVKEEIETPSKKKRGRPKKEQKEIVAEKKHPGRPRKVDSTKVQVVEPKKKRGRPRKVDISKEEVVESKKKRGRPKKNQDTLNNNVTVKTEKSAKISSTGKKKRGRPAKNKPVEEKVETAKPKKRGRPKKVKTQENESVENVKTPSKKRGRPRKSTGESENPQQPGQSTEEIDSYLKKIDEEIAKENVKFEKAKKALEKKTKIRNKKTKKSSK